jgi:hypothetical protein
MMFFPVALKRVEIRHISYYVLMIPFVWDGVNGEDLCKSLARMGCFD